VELFSRLATRPVYNTRAVVLRTGVPADTFRAWERRYGIPTPVRTSGNQRLYSERDVALIAWLRDQTRSGVTISQAIKLFKSRGREEGERSQPSLSLPARDVEPAPSEGQGLRRYTDRLVDALIAYDSRTASHLLEEVLAIVPVEDVCLHVLQPALHEIGLRWQRDEILISGEHFASSFAMRTLGALFNQSRPEEGRGPIIATCLEGELHETGLLMTSLFLSRRGFRVVYLGGNLPVGDLVETILDIRPRIVLLSASTPEGAVNLARASGEIKMTCKARRPLGWAPEIGFGGKIFVDMPFLQEGVDGIYCGHSANEGVEKVEGIFDRVAVSGARI
jgi:MerR family transcriptional regulator, light-induced transcriptional regulator